MPLQSVVKSPFLELSTRPRYLRRWMWMRGRAERKISWPRMMPSSSLWWSMGSRSYKLKMEGNETESRHYPRVTNISSCCCYRPRYQSSRTTDSKSEFVSPRQLPRVQSITAIPPGRRPSEDLLNQPPELGHRVTLPPLQSISLPSSVVTSPDSGSSKPNAKFLPSIQSAPRWVFTQRVPSTRLSGLPPLCPSSSCPRSATSTDSPNEASKNPSRPSQPSSAFWRGCPSSPPPPPPQPADTPHHAPTPYVRFSPVTRFQP